MDLGELSSSAPLAFALAAGMAATVNPCGFVMLPAFVSYQLGERDSGYDQLGLAPRLWRAIVLGVTVTLGFIVVFAGVGLVLAGGGRVILRAVPWAGLIVGLVLVVLGLAFVLGKVPFLQLQLATAGQGGVGARRSGSLRLRDRVRACFSRLHAAHLSGGPRELANDRGSSQCG